MSLSLANLLDLPEGAGYTQEDGRSSVKAERSGDSLRVTGRCEELERECWWYEELSYRATERADSLERELKEVERQLRQAESSKTEEHIEAKSESRKPPNRLWTITASYLAGAGTGILLTRKRRKRQ